MPTIVSHSIIEDGSGDYTSVDAWQSGTVRDLVAADEIEHGIIQGSWTNPETESIAIGGWTSDATRYIILEATGAARHDGKWTDTAWRQEFTGDPPLPGSFAVGTLTWCDLIGLQVSLINRRIGGKGAYSTGATTGGLRLRMDSCIGVVDACIAGGAYAGFFQEGTVQLRNCTAYHINPQATHWARGWGWHGVPNGVDQNLAYNCNALDFKENDPNAAGFYVHVPGVDVLVINCISSGSEGEAFYSFVGDNWASGSDFNVSDKGMDAGARGVNSRESQSVTFVDAPNNDYHLDVADLGAKGFGRDPSGMPEWSFSHDIDGDTRSSPFDIGVDELVDLAPPPTPEGLLFPDGLSDAVPSVGLLYPRYRTVIG